MSDFGSDPTDTDEEGDSDPASGPRPDAVERRLARGVPDDPSLGELAVRAEALGDALELAEADPEQASALVPAISHTLVGIAPVHGGKGRAYLLGAFETAVFRRGLAAIAALDVAHVPLDATESLDGILEVVQTVLSDAEDTETCRNAIRAFGVIAAARPDWTARWVANNCGERRLYRFNEQVEMALEETVDLEQLVSLLQTVGVLASHDRLSVLVDTLSRGAIERCATIDEYRIETWVHVIGRELGYDSLVDLADVWERIEDERRPVGLYRWLLVTDGGEAIPDLGGAADAAAIVLQKQRHVGVTTVATLPDSLVDTSDRIDQFAALATRAVDGYPRIQKRAVTCLGAVATAPGLSATEATRLVEEYESILDGHDRRVQKQALPGLKRLATSDGLPSEIRVRAVDALSRATANDDAGVRHTALRQLGTMVTPDADAPADRVRAVLEAALDHADPVVRATAAWELTRTQRSDDQTDPARTDAVAPLGDALDSDDADVRELAIERSELLASSAVVPTDLRREAVGVLERATELDSADRRSDALKALGAAADTDDQAATTHRRIFTTLEAALEDPATQVWNAAADALCRQAGGETTPPALCDRAISKLGDVLQDLEPLSGGTVSRAFVEWVGRAAVSGAVSDTTIAAIETALETPNAHDRAQVVRGLVLLLQAESADLSAGQRSRIRDSLLTAVGDDDRHVQEAAVDGLTAWAETVNSPTDAGAAVVTALRTQLDGESRDGRLNASEGLRTVAASDRFDDETRALAAEAIASTLDADDPRLRVSAALDIVELSETELFGTATVTRAQDVLQAAQHADSPVARLYIPDRLGTLVAKQLPIQDHRWIWTLFLTALNDDRQEIREAAARGIRDACAATSPSSNLVAPSVVSDLGDALSPSDPEVTRHLLTGLRSLARDGARPLGPLRAPLRDLLTEDAPVDVQVTALWLLSLLGDRTTTEGFNND